MADARARIRLTIVAAVLAAASLSAQEGKTPSDSELVSLPGCAKGRVFTVHEAPEHEPQQSAVAPGRRFRLTGRKDALKEIRGREGRLIEVTGLVRKADLQGPGGIAIAGGRIRIGGASPRSPMNSPGRDPQYNVAVLDVSAWRSLAGECPTR